MKVLFATDIILSYLKKRDYYEGVSLLVDWIGRVGDEKCFDFSTLVILTHFAPNEVLGDLKTFTLIKKVNKPSVRIADAIHLYCVSRYMTRHAMNGMKIHALHLELLRTQEVDFVVSETPEFFEVAKQLGYDDRVYHIETFIEKYAAEHRELDESKGVVVKRCAMGEYSLEQSFFDTFRQEYEPHYTPWFLSKKKEPVFVSVDKNDQLKAILKLKLETEDEDYTSIKPIFTPKKRLKISSFKVDYTGQKLGERFIRIALEEAIKWDVDEVYGTIYKNSVLRMRLVNLLKTWGFREWGRKGDEYVLVRDMKVDLTGNLRGDFPFHQYNGYAYIVPLSEFYFDQLLPSAEVRFSEEDYEPQKSAIRKVLVLNESQDLPYGSILLFYKRTPKIKERGIMAVGVVEKTHCEFKSSIAFINRCRKHSVLPDSQLMDCWTRLEGKVSAVDFLFTQSLLRGEIDVERLEKEGIDTNSIYSQHVYPLTEEQFYNLINGTSYESRIILHKA